jgi:hypothetical protein
MIHPTIDVQRTGTARRLRRGAFERSAVSPGHASGHLLQHVEKKRIFVMIITAQARRPS